MRQVSRRPFPPASLVEFVGSIARPLPLAPLQPVLDLALLVMRRRHPSVFERLRELGEAAVLLDPVDLPAVFVFQPGCRRPRLKIARDAAQVGQGIPVAASIRAPLSELIDILEGRLDADALFFTRELNIHGDTEAVLMLRNAIESDEVDVLDDILAPLGPLAEPARNVAEGLAKVISGGAELLHALLTGNPPPTREGDGV